MNTLEAIAKLEAGEAIPRDTPVKVRGYNPCRLSTGSPFGSRPEIYVVFEGGRRMKFPVTMLLYGHEDIQRGYARA